MIATGRGSLAWLTVAAALLLAGCVSRGGDPSLYPPQPGEPTVTVYLVHNGLHSNLALPTGAVRRHEGPSSLALANLPPAPWVLAGWGDAKFYREQGAVKGRLIDALRSLFKPGNASVVHLQMLDRAPDELYEARYVSPIVLSERGFARMATALDAAFELEDGRPVDAGPGIVGATSSRFFDGSETFSLARLCNHWTSSLLNAAGVPTRRFTDTLPSGLARDVRPASRPAESR